MRIAIAAGESSGDALGAGLIDALKSGSGQSGTEPGGGVNAIDFVGIAGPRMRAAGCDAWFRSEELSVMGLAEVLRHLPRLLKIRSRLAERLLARPPDVFVGIDSPDFNLPLAARLKRAGIPTIQYVSPQVWAWRQSRVAKIAAAVDMVLCVLPFETDFYSEHGVPARFVGHPLADEIPPSVDRASARAALGIALDQPMLALLPGSRRSEVSRLARPFAETAVWLSGRIAGLNTSVAIAHDGLSQEWQDRISKVPGAAEFRCFVGRARDVMTAADVVLTASGTASLEACLLGRPLVVGHRMSRLSYWILRRMGIQKLPFYTLPNLLAGSQIAPEHVQAEARAEVLGASLLRAFEHDRHDAAKLAVMRSIHEQLRQGGSATAAAAVLELAASGGASA